MQRAGSLILTFEFEGFLPELMMVMAGGGPEAMVSDVRDEPILTTQPRRRDSTRFRGEGRQGERDSRQWSVGVDDMTTSS